MKTEIEYKIEFGKQVQKYLVKSGLNVKDFATLINSNVDNVNDIISGKVGLNISRMVKIASLFGIEYYNFANPNFPIPTKSELTINLKEVLSRRKIIGDKSNDTKRLLSKELDRLINDGFLCIPTTSKILHKKMDAELENRNPSEITTLLSQPPRSEYIKTLDQRYITQSIYIHKDYLDEYCSFSKEKLAEIILSEEVKLGLDKK